MKKIFILIVSLIYFSSLALNNAVTYEDNGARLGDRIICYLHAKWISYKYNMPLYFIPFPYSDQLKLFNIEQKHITKSQINKVAKEYKGKKIFGSGQTFQPQDNCLHVIPYFPESLEEHRPRKSNHPYKKPNPRSFPTAYFEVNWNDPNFKLIVQKLISPKSNLQLTKPPKEHYSIALHVRKGRGFDPVLLSETPRNQLRYDILYHDVGAPWKVPPDEYYLKELIEILKEISHQKIYVHIFSDDPQIEALASKYKQAITDPRVSWGYRTASNNHDNGVLEDLFSISKNFNCLIRGDSNFSIVSDIIGNHEYVASPADHEFINGYLCITKTRIKKSINGQISKQVISRS